MSSEFIRPTREQIAFGVSGQIRVDEQVQIDGLSARAALEEEVRRALVGRPAYVSFSGGRDSSAILAVAVTVARRDGLPEPTPVTLRYPGDVDSEEARWQELVLEHLHIRDRVIIDVEQPATYLDASVQSNLRRRGLVWPAALQLDSPVFDIAEGGILLTGEGGDEVLGTRRITPLALLIHMHRKPRLRLLQRAAESVIPRRVNRLLIANQLRNSPISSWLTPHGVSRFIDATADSDRRPLHWGRETEQMIRSRVPNVLAHNYAAVASERRVELHHPLQSPVFLMALAAQGGRWGYAGRTDAMRRLFADVLPDELLRRDTKAHFGTVRWGRPERDFAQSWDGQGLPADLIDAEALRRHWLSARPLGASVLALHAAWLDSEGISWEGAG